MELPPKACLDSGHIFYVIELEQRKRFLSLDCYFTVMSTLALQVTTVGVTSSPPHAIHVSAVLLPIVHVSIMYAAHILLNEYFKPFRSLRSHIGTM
jgi:hypothetical protein